MHISPVKDRKKIPLKICRNPNVTNSSTSQFETVFETAFETVFGTVFETNLTVFETNLTIFETTCSSLVDFTKGQ